MTFEPTPVETPAELDSALARGVLEDLAQRYYAPLRSFFRKRTRNAAEVPDLVQQVFLRLAQYRGLTCIHNPDSFIFRTASNILKDHHRYRALREHPAGDPATILHFDLSPERVLAGKQTLARLKLAVRQLPERTRDVFVLRCFEDLNNAEIARLQRISVRAVEKHLVKALTHIGQVMDAGPGGESER